MEITKYFIAITEDETEEEVLDRVQNNITTYVENNMDISATIIKREGFNQIEVRILKLNEHRN